MPQFTEKFDFTNNEGHKLSGRLEIPKGKIKAYALFAHCFTCSKNILAASKISKSLSEKGIAVLRFDFTGIGNSEGDFGNSGFSSNTEDLISAYNALSQAYEAPQILIGHSLGGAAVLKACQSLPEVQSVITIGAPSDVKHVTHLFKDALDEINSCNSAKVLLGGKEFTITKSFIKDLEESTLLEGLSQTKKSFLIMHSPTDDYVSVDHAAHIYQALKHPKSYISLDSIDHLISQPKDALYISHMISAWVDRYLAADKDQEELNLEKESVLVKSRDGFKYTHDIHTQKHYLVADEPKSVKGDDLGMTPIELLLSSLGACTAMTTKMYAERKEFDLKNVEVKLRKEGERIIKSISLSGNLSPEESGRILEIAEKCPVNKILKNGIEVITEE